MTSKSPLLVAVQSSPNDSIAIMFNSSKKQKTSTRKTSNARGPYREFNDASKSMRDILIRGYAERYIEDVAANKNGRCSYRFVANLVREAASVAGVLKISNQLAPSLTSNVIFGSGDGILGPCARNEAIRRRQVIIDKVDAAMQKKKLELTESLKAYRKLKSEPIFGNPDFKWTIEKLKIAIKVKKLPGDKAMPTSKEALLD